MRQQTPLWRKNELRPKGRGNWVPLLLCCTALCVLTPVSLPAFAQTAQSIASVLEVKKLSAEKDLEERVRRVIGNQLETPYLLYIKITLNEKTLKALTDKFSKPLRLKTLPGSSAPALTMVRDLNSEELYFYVKNINVTLTLDSSVPEETAKAIHSSIWGALGLNDGRGDKVDIQRANMTSGSMKMKLEQAQKETEFARDQVRKMEAMMRELEMRKEKASADVSKYDERNSRIAEDLRRLTDDLRSTKDSISDIRTALAASKKLEQERLEHESTPLERIKSAIRGFEIPLTILPLGLIGAFLYARYVRSQTENGPAIREGLSGLVQALQGMSESFAAKSDATVLVDSEDEKGDHADGSGGGGVHAVHANGGELQLLREEAKRTWELINETPYFALSVLKDWLVESDSRGRFMQVSEAIGAQAAQELWSKFPREELDLLGPLLDKPVSLASAYSSIPLLYRNATREAASKPAFASQINPAFVIKLSDEKLAAMLSQGQLDGAAFVLAILTPKRVARVLPLIATHAREDLVRAIAAVQNVNPEQAKRFAAGLDKNAQTWMESGGAAALVDYLVTLLESTSEANIEAANAVLSANEQLAAQVRKRILTWNDVLRLDSESFYDLLSPLGAADLAALIFTSSKEEAEHILSFFTGKMKYQIDSEIKKIDQKTKLKRQAKFVATKLRSLLINRVKVMRERGLIELATDRHQGSEGPADDAQQAS